MTVLEKEKLQVSKSTFAKIVIVGKKNSYFPVMKMILFAYSWHMPENLFCESVFTLQCTLNNPINAITFVNTYAIEYIFIVA